MLISIVIPAYNAGSTLQICLASIFAQSYRDIEVIVIDDGSTDNTQAVLKSITDPRLMVFSYENAGVSIARQRGLEIASGDYVIFVDADDTVNIDLCQNVYNIIKSGDTDIVRFQAKLLNDPIYKDHTRYNFYDSAKRSVTGLEALRAWSIPQKKYAVYWLYAFKRNLFENITFPNLRCHEDLAVIPLLIATAKRVVTIDYIGYNYSCNVEGSITTDKSLEAEKSRAIDFLEAFNYAIENFIKLDNITAHEIAFLAADFKIRLNEKFVTLSEELKSEFAKSYNII